MINFSKNLFWDVDAAGLNKQKHRRFIIERVLTRGRMSDWWVLIQLYSFIIIKREIVQIRYLDKITLNFCSTFFHIPKTEFRCYNQPQSIKKLWNY